MSNSVCYILLHDTFSIVDACPCRTRRLNLGCIIPEFGIIHCQEIDTRCLPCQYSCLPCTQVIATSEPLTISLAVDRCRPGIGAGTENPLWLYEYPPNDHAGPFAMWPQAKWIDSSNCTHIFIFQLILLDKWSGVLRGAWCECPIVESKKPASHRGYPRYRNRCFSKYLKKWPYPCGDHMATLMPLMMVERSTLDKDMVSMVPREWLWLWYLQP